MNILLAAPSAQTRFEYFPSIGLMNLFLIAKDLGCHVEYLDLTEDSYAKGVDRILENQYDLVGVSCSFTNTAPYCMTYARKIKAKFPDTEVIAGGIHATFVPEDLLFNQYDAVVYGEGELTFKRFLRQRLKGESVKHLEGICRLQDGRVIKNPPAERIENLDDLPVNDYTHFDMEPYFKRAGIRLIQMMTSRGCRFNCRFCSTVRMWGRHRQQSARRMVREFLTAKQMGVEYISIEDDDFCLNEKNVREFCRLLTEENAVIPWSMTLGARSVSDESTLDLLARSGCRVAGISIESASPKILKQLGRVYTVDDNIRMFRALKKRNIMVENKGLIGFSDESVKDVVMTYRHLFHTSDFWHGSILEPRPGCEYWESWEKKGDTAQYERFGKGNVFFAKNKTATYILFRFFAVLYLLSPRRVFLSLFGRDPIVRYWHRKYYIMAYWTLKANIEDFLGWFSPKRES